MSDKRAVVCIGMQKHHAAREVFLTQMVDNNDVECLWRLAQVCLPDAFCQATGDDAFVCEYEYDTVWQVCEHPPPPIACLPHAHNGKSSGLMCMTTLVSFGKKLVIVASSCHASRQAHLTAAPCLEAAGDLLIKSHWLI